MLTMLLAYNVPTWVCFDLDLNTGTITCNLVEVKCYSQVGAFAAFNQLKERISAQINQSERILQRHFDPALKNRIGRIGCSRAGSWLRFLGSIWNAHCVMGSLKRLPRTKREDYLNPLSRATRFNSGGALWFSTLTSLEQNLRTTRLASNSIVSARISFMPCWRTAASLCLSRVRKYRPLLL